MVPSLLPLPSLLNDRFFVRKTGSQQFLDGHYFCRVIFSLMIQVDCNRNPHRGAENDYVEQDREAVFQLLHGVAKYSP